MFLLPTLFPFLISLIFHSLSIFPTMSLFISLFLSLTFPHLKVTHNHTLFHAHLHWPIHAKLVVILSSSTTTTTISLLYHLEKEKRKKKLKKNSIILGNYSREVIKILSIGRPWHDIWERNISISIFWQCMVNATMQSNFWGLKPPPKGLQHIEPTTRASLPRII